TFDSVFISSSRRKPGPIPPRCGFTARNAYLDIVGSRLSPMGANFRLAPIGFSPSPDRRLGEGAQRADEGPSKARAVPVAPSLSLRGPHPALRATFSLALRARAKGE